MIILGIDPGIATVGFGAVEAGRGAVRPIRYGVISTPAGLPLSSRLSIIYRDMEELIGTLHPDEMAVEELFFNTNLTTGISVAHGRGVILLAAEQLGVPVFEYTPMQVKLAVTGYGKADKHQIQTMVRMMLSLGEIPRPDDAADALAVAITHANSMRAGQMFKIK